MPGVRRRTMDEDDGSDGPSSSDSEGSKRRRLNSQAPSSNDSEGELLPASYRNEARDETDEKHAPGSLLRISVTNFVTYTKAVFNCGPSLNMIIGPNGTGKSTLVCAICLGLGWKPTVLGRAKDIGEFVKHGFQEAEIEVELAAKKDGDRNPVIHHIIKRDGNKSLWMINGKTTTHKQVMTLVRSFNIQIDNLCQFLPQDRVVEFAQMTPVGLLESTQKAAASEEMTVQHTRLKKLGTDRMQHLETHQQSMDSLANLEKRQAAQQIDVERQNERLGLVSRLAGLEKARPGLKYAIEKAQVEVMKNERRELERALQQLKDEMAPQLAQIAEKESYFKDCERGADQARKLADRAERAVNEYPDFEKDFKSQDQTLTDQKEKLAADEKKNTAERKRIEGSINGLKKQLEEDPPEFDAAAMNVRIREKKRQINEIENQARDLTEKRSELKHRLDTQTQERHGLNNELKGLTTQTGQQLLKLAKLSADSAKAWNYIQKHPEEFKKTVYGPPLVECTIKDPRYTASVEGLLGRADLICITATCQEDWNTIRRVQDQLHLTDVYARTIYVGMDRYPPLASNDELKSYGLDHWAHDLINGPEPLIAMLCDNTGLNRAGVSLKDQTNDQFEVLKDSPISRWVAGQSSYVIRRRREFGPSAVTTAVNPLRPPQFWTSAGVDVEAQNSLKRRVRELETDIAGHEDSYNEIKEEILQLGANRQAFIEEKDIIEREKEAYQKAQATYQAIPIRITTLEQKWTTLNEQDIQFFWNNQKNLLNKKKNILDKQKKSAEWVTVLDTAQKLHEELVPLELQVIEAESDFDQAKERNAEAHRLLGEHTTRIQHLEQTIRDQTSRCKTLLNQIKKIQSDLSELEDAESASLQAEVMNEWLAPDPNDETPRTPDDLEAEIASTEQRIELLHEGNPDAVRQFATRAKQIEKVKNDIANFELNLNELNKEVATVRANWEPKLDKLVDRISAAFAHNFERIGCAGQVSVHKDEEDFREWSIKIEVKFRENEELSVLDSHRQSGGERAVSTIFYLMALQSMAKSPFRVVDEINQGMDPRNERMVHGRMVEIACTEGKSQYFLVTPKLLNNLEYHKRMAVHVIYSGEEVPADAGDDALDFGALADRALAKMTAMAH